MVRIERDPAVVGAFLSDAAHVSGGHADGVAFPASSGEVAALVRSSAVVLPVGAQSSLTGGATPRGGIVLSTRALAHVEPQPDGTVRVGAGVPLARLQRELAVRGAWYPPAPTFDGAFAGGTVATNAAGAATFKYGSTRAWVEELTVVLADGTVLDVRRGERLASAGGVLEVPLASGSAVRVPVPTYHMPGTAKLSAGYFARQGMDLVDLFIGSEGTLGVITAVTLRTRPIPRRVVALITCADDDEAGTVSAALRTATRADAQDAPLDVAAIEYMDASSLSFVADQHFARTGLLRPAAGAALLLVQLEVDDVERTLHGLQTLLDRCGVAADPIVTAPGDDRSAQRLFDLREAVPAGVNAAVAATKARLGDGIEKTAGDFVVPFPALAESIALYRRVFRDHGLRGALWGHVSDGNLHPNVIPSSLDDVRRGREALLAMARGVIAMGGSPLAEHGVGRVALKQRLLVELYGEQGVAEMRAVKQALDPEWKLAPGVVFPRT
jgi:D-lactate dehydrogenase (cytochrome)